MKGLVKLHTSPFAGGYEHGDGPPSARDGTLSEIGLENSQGQVPKSRTSVPHPSKGKDPLDKALDTVVEPWGLGSNEDGCRGSH